MDYYGGFERRIPLEDVDENKGDGNVQERAAHGDAPKIGFGY
jgi:hypothetical protein